MGHDTLLFYNRSRCPFPPQLHVTDTVLERVSVTADGASGETAGLGGARRKHHVAIAVVGIVAEVCRGATAGTAAGH